MEITVWGSRGSLPAPGPESYQFGGNTSCVQIHNGGSMVILDAGSGIRRMNSVLTPEVTKIDILLTHLHLDHIMGLGFFGGLYNPNVQVNIWGPTSTKDSLQTRLTRYLSPPLFPIRLQDLPCQLKLIEINHSEFEIDDIKINSAYVCHPGPTLGYRLETNDCVISYIPDHEPCLGASNWPTNPDWTSGFDLAENADLLFHDAQYTAGEYSTRVGWGHSTMKDTLDFAKLTKVKNLQFFHHDPSHTDEQLQSFLDAEMVKGKYEFEVGIAAEGNQFSFPSV